MACGVWLHLLLLSQGNGALQVLSEDQCYCAHSLYVAVVEVAWYWRQS